MIYCKKCCQPDTRPGIMFYDGICYACLYSENKHKIDWDYGLEQLRGIATWAKLKNNVYDCVLGVSGGKDTTYSSLYARGQLGLRCLLVNSEPEGITEIGKKNIENLKRLGFDVISIRPNPQVMKQLVKKDFYEHLNPVKVTEFSLWASAYIIADKFNIPLIIQGENPTLTLGTAKTVEANDDALNADKQNTLASGHERYIGEGITRKDLFLFHYNRNSINRQGIKAIWLGYYDKDWSSRRNAEFAIKHGLTIRTDFKPEDIGTHYPFAQMDSDLGQVNQLFKYYKFGFGQCTDHVCYDIREGLIDRKEGFRLIELYDDKCSPVYIKKFCDYINITESEMWETVDKFVNKELFYKEGNQWKRKFNYE